MPPPNAEEEFPEIVQFVRMAPKPALKTPPPSPGDEVTEFPEIVQFVRMAYPLLSTPPPTDVETFPEIVQFVRTTVLLLLLTTPLLPLFETVTFVMVKVELND